MQDLTIRTLRVSQTLPSLHTTHYIPTQHQHICYSSCVYLSVCLTVCSLTPSIGKTDSVAASSCKEVRDVLSNECSGRPQSGTYWINMTDQCTGDNKTMRVGQKHTCLRVHQVERRLKSKHDMRHRSSYKWRQSKCTLQP